MCLQSISCLFQRKVQWQPMHFGTAHSSIPVRKKIAFAHPCHGPAFQPLKAFFPFPPYRCLSLRFSLVTHRKSHRFPMFLQHIAGIPFSDINRRFIPAVYALPSPRTAVWHCPVPAQSHTAAFPNLSLCHVSILSPSLEIGILAYELFPVKDSSRSQVHFLIPKHVDMQHQY